MELMILYVYRDLVQLDSKREGLSLGSYILASSDKKLYVGRRYQADFAASRTAVHLHYQKCVCISRLYFALHFNRRQSMLVGLYVFQCGQQYISMCTYIRAMLSPTTNQHIITAYKLTNWLNEEIAKNSVGLYYIKMYVHYKYL